MKNHDNVTGPNAVTLSPSAGMFFTVLGVVAFSMSFTATRAAVTELGAITVGLGRAAMASLLAAIYLRATRAALPTRAEWRSLALVAGGVVVGFPLLSAIALQSLSASHGNVIIGLAPTLTAVVATLRAGERPSRVFWVASLVGTAAVVAFGWQSGHGRFGSADALLLVGVVLVAVGYAEGGKLSVSMGGSRVISWALVLALPLTGPATALALVLRPLAAAPSAAALAGLAYVTVVSMLLGFFAYYRGLAIVGVARASQVQLLQVPLGALWSTLLLGERVTPALVATSATVVVCAAVARRARVAQAPLEPKPTLVAWTRPATDTAA